MKRLVTILFCSGLLLLSNASKAQDTLPKFNIRDINDKKILITWISTFGDSCIQLAVQRSFDSTHFFSTIYSAQSPELPQNGYVDLRMPKGVKVFYRIFYVLAGGSYYFTKSRGLYTYKEATQSEPQIKIIEPIKKDNPREIGKQEITDSNSFKKGIDAIKVETKTYINIFKRSKDTLFAQLEYKDYKHLRDSVLYRTKDTLYTIDQSNVIIKPFVPKPVWKASTFVFATEQTNRVTLHLPQSKIHKYRVVFFDSNGEQLFEIKQPKDDNLILDNSNFIRGGWYSFDLYQDEKLKEHNKFQLLIPF